MGDVLFEDSWEGWSHLDAVPPGGPECPRPRLGIISAYTCCRATLAQQTAELRKAIFPLRAWPATCQGRVYLAPRAC